VDEHVPGYRSTDQVAGRYVDPWVTVARLELPRAMTPVGGTAAPGVSVMATRTSIGVTWLATTRIWLAVVRLRALSIRTIGVIRRIGAGAAGILFTL